MPPIDPIRAREFAVDIVRRLRAGGHQALWAGGCVRDQLLGLAPHDYDVATDATPDQVREVFGRRRTLAIGAAFGVITVLGSKAAGQIDVATFRRDANYSDGRHPDAVSFSDAEHDAQRRDFTINGLFYDPLAQKVIDYVGGEVDLERKVIRSIGDPDARIAEDKLRMLRAVRFAARFGFALDGLTHTAIERHAAELQVVSAERVASELRLIFTRPSRSRGLELLASTGLFAVVLPEAAALGSGDRWKRTLAILDAFEGPTFPMALAVVLRELSREPGAADLPQILFERWKLSTEELEGTRLLLREEPAIRTARQLPWSKLQPMLIVPGIAEVLGYCAAVAEVEGGGGADIEYCRAQLALPPAQLNPPPLISGENLKQLGLPPGPLYRELLEAVRDAQLDQRLATREEALAFVGSYGRQ